MKCSVCGHDEQSEMDERLRDDGSKPFIRLKYGSREHMDREGNYYNMPNVIYACPVCGTLKMEV